MKWGQDFVSATFADAAAGSCRDAMFQSVTAYELKRIEDLYVQKLQELCRSVSPQ